MIRGVSALAGDFDGFILDIWGVIHDGRALYPGVLDALDRLTASGKAFVMLSNAPGRARTVADMLAGFGLPERHCRSVVLLGRGDMAGPEDAIRSVARSTWPTLLSDGRGA